MLAILEYKAGNQTSVRRALEHLGIPCVVTADPAVLSSAAGVIFPGVGAAGQAMGHLHEAAASGGVTLAETLGSLVGAGRPLLGICLGCQILLDSSEENSTKTLGLVQGQSLRFTPELKDDDGSLIRIPHMGWNSIHTQRDSLLLKDVPEDAEFYFVHSYYVQVPENMIIATTRYGLDFCSIYGRDGLWAVQFHLEKSGQPGLQLLKNFYGYCRKGANHAQ